jgi:hypothetical protein
MFWHRFLNDWPNSGPKDCGHVLLGVDFSWDPFWNIFLPQSPNTISEICQNEPGPIPGDNSCRVRGFLLPKNPRHFGWSYDPLGPEFLSRQMGYPLRMSQWELKRVRQSVLHCAQTNPQLLCTRLTTMTLVFVEHWYNFGASVIETRLSCQMLV